MKRDQRAQSTKKQEKNPARIKEAPLIGYRLLLTTSGNLISEVQKVSNENLNKVLRKLNIQTIHEINSIHKLALELIDDTDRQVSKTFTGKITTNL